MTTEEINIFMTLVDTGVQVVPGLSLILFTIGFIIKHTPACDIISNDAIPCILIVIGVIVSMATQGWTVASAVSGILAAVAATGIHQVGKTTASNSKKDNTKEE